MTDSPVVEVEAGSAQVTEAPLKVLLRLVSGSRLYRSADGALHARVIDRRAA